MLALEGKAVDRAPLAHVSALTTVELQQSTGCSMPGVHTNPEDLARLGAANHEILGFDAVSFIINYFNEPVALGCAVDWGSNRRLPMYMSHPWQTLDDVKKPADLLDRSPVKECLETIRIAKKKYGSDTAVLGKVMGPLSMVQVMQGVETVMLNMMDSPEVIQQMMEVAADILIECANAQFDAGADAVSLGEGGAGANMVSPPMHREFLLSVHKRMVEEIHGPLIIHICGDITPRIDLIMESGFKCFNFDWAVDIDTLRKATEGRLSIMGNINTTALLQGDPEEIEKEVFACLDGRVDIVSPGCAISPECPNANIRAMREGIDKWYQQKG